jgi:hypothetical protein
VLDKCIDRAIFKMFGINGVENVRYLKSVFGIHCHDIIENRKCKFFDRIFRIQALKDPKHEAAYKMSLESVK